MPKKTGLIFFPAFDWAISPTHPERQERLLYTQDQVFEEGLLDFDNIIEFKPSIAAKEDLDRTHICVPDASHVTTDSHLIAAGGAIRAAEITLNGEVDNAFALVRPPGHHAMKVVHGSRGFCNINIEAIMIDYIRKHYGPKRIAVVDTDCHHGDGTQDIFWHDPHTLCISIHQDGRTLYPGTGFHQEMGGPNAVGTTINIPLPPGTSEEGFAYVLDHAILPIIHEFQPDIIINSAGQDNHYTDPITNMRFTARGYALLNEKLSPHIAVLEGGYSIETALPYINVGIILAMAGLDHSYVCEPDYHRVSHTQTHDISRMVEKSTSEACKIWQQKDILKNRIVGNSTSLTRRKHIYYDTDGISEEQEETVRVCDQCGGMVSIDSHADTGRRIFAVIVPYHSCSACRLAGENLYEKTAAKYYHHVYFQDKDNDRFFVK